MNALLWLLQIVLDLLFVSGGSYKIFAFDDSTPQMMALSRQMWSALGVLEVVGGLLLVVPQALGWMPRVTSIAAAVLAVENLALAALFASYSVAFEATNPFVWVLPMGVAAAVVAYGRAKD
jgi:uncharacterized membrane protein YphA (DoxX/SURF4 family)